jgi:hypothetical protein
VGSPTLQWLRYRHSSSSSRGSSFVCKLHNTLVLVFQLSSLHCSLYNTFWNVCMQALQLCKRSKYGKAITGMAHVGP